jgi:type IV pilus assembly protein PilB
MAVSDEQLIEAGVQTNLVEPQTLEKLRINARKQRLPILPVILAEFRFPRTALFRALAEIRNIEFVSLSQGVFKAEELIKKFLLTY